MSKTHKKTYLGDGVYAAIEEFGLVLTTENGIEATNTIVLEPAVLRALEEWIERMGVSQV